MVPESFAGAGSEDLVSLQFDTFIATFETFTGGGFAPAPAAGQLDSDLWRVTGLSDGDGTFGGTHDSGDFARGSSNGGVSTGGIYAFNVGGGNDILGVQPGSNDFTPGTITLQLTNNTGAPITDLDVSYDIWVFNDQPRANSLNFAYSTDDSSYTPVSALDFTTPEAADGSPAWQSQNQSTTITGLNIPVDGSIFLQWQSNDISGSGSRDEFGIDNVTVTNSSGGGGGPTTGQPLPLTENFDSCTLPGFQIISVDADTANTWSCSESFNNIEANGFGDSAAAEEWLITPPLDLTAQENEILTFRNQTSFTDSGVAYPQLQVLYSTDYSGSGNPNDATWIPLTGINFSPENSGTFVDSGDVDISTIDNDNVYFAFRYTSSGTGSGTASRWRLDDIQFVVDDGSGSTTLTIPEIQGAGHVSPFVPGLDLANLPPDTLSVSGDTVTTSGVVTATDTNGFYLQDPTGDGDIATSDAIFVFTGSAPSVSVGDVAEVTGTVSEFFPGDTDTRNLPTTQISAASVTPQGTASLPTPVIIGTGGRVPPNQVINSNSDLTDFDAVNDGIDFFESLEAMLVTAQNAVAVAGTNRFGEIFTVVDNGAGATGISSRGTLNISPTDFNPEKVQIDEDTGILPGFTLPQVGVGASLGNVTGVISYDFGNYQIQPTQTFSGSGAPTPETSSLAPSSEELLVATYNVLNLDPNDGDGDTDVADGRFAAIAQQIVTNLNSPDVIALQEVQDNSGSVDNGIIAADMTLQMLIDAITTAGGPTYEFIDNTFIGNNLSGGQPGGNIRTAFLYNPSRVTLDDTSVQTIDGQMMGEAFFDARLPLVATFEFNGEDVTLVNNHFSSKGGSAPIFGTEQPFDARQEDVTVNGSLDERQRQSTAVQGFVSDLLTSDPDANVVVLGDLNEFEFVSPVTGLEAAGLTNLVNDLDPDEIYSFIFQGNSQQLDHILVSDSLNSSAEVDIVHVNTEFPETPDRASDHDPVLARFTLTSTGEAQLEVGDVQILGYRTGFEPGFTFVIWEDITAGTTIGFTDESISSAGGFIGGLFARVSENTLIWQATSDLPAGTVVVIDDNTADIGEVTGGSLSTLSSRGDQIFAYQGAREVSNLLFGLNFGTSRWIDSGTADPFRSYLPSILDVDGGNIDAGAVGRNNSGQYSGSRSGETTVADYQALIYDGSNRPVEGNWAFVVGFPPFSLLNLDSTDFSGLP
jgi:predicted extracellular nuclease